MLFLLAGFLGAVGAGLLVADRRMRARALDEPVSDTTTEVVEDSIAPGQPEETADAEPLAETAAKPVVELAAKNTAVASVDTKAALTSDMEDKVEPPLQPEETPAAEPVAVQSPAELIAEAPEDFEEGHTSQQVTAGPLPTGEEDEAPAIKHPHRSTLAATMPGAARRERRRWAQEQGYTFTKTDTFLTEEWSRGAASVGAPARDVVSGTAYGKEFHLMDLAGVPVLAIRREQASDIVVDARRAGMPAEESEDLMIVHTIAGFEMHANDQGAAQRFCDIRVEAALSSMPATVQAVWLESDWALTQTLKGSTPRDWETIIGSLATVADAARVLPPRAGATQALEWVDCDPTRPMVIISAPAGVDEDLEEEVPVIPQRVRGEQTHPRPSRAAAAARGVVEPREIGGDEIDPIGVGGPGPNPSDFRGTRVLRDISGDSDIFKDASDN